MGNKRISERIENIAFHFLGLVTIALLVVIAIVGTLGGGCTDVPSKKIGSIDVSHV